MDFEHVFDLDVRFCFIFAVVLCVFCSGFPEVIGLSV